MLPGTIRFKDKNDDVYFDFKDKLRDSSRTSYVKTVRGEKTTTKLSVNPRLLTMYAIYRNTLEESYGANPNLAADIKAKTAPLLEDTALIKIMSKAGYSDDKKRLRLYAMEVAAGVMKDWKTPSENIHAYIAYENADGKEKHIGFVHFLKKDIQGRSVVYIAEAGVSKRGASVGRRLMECVISHFPAGTEFLILARAFNTEAKTLYKDRLGFDPIKEDEIAILGYSKDRYVGFSKVSTKEEIIAIRNNQVSNIARPRAVS